MFIKFIPNDCVHPEFIIEQDGEFIKFLCLHANGERDIDVEMFTNYKFAEAYIAGIKWVLKMFRIYNIKEEE